MIISIGCTALILTAVIFTQFKTVEQTDITAIETMRETELKSELTNWKNKYDEVEDKINVTKQKINEYNQTLSSSQDSAEMIKNEIKEDENYLGYTNVYGEGIVITLTDSEDDDPLRKIDYSDLLTLINELKLAGAEAISVNDKRIVNTSEITLVKDEIMIINTSRVSNPYVVKAIGNKKYLESSITIKGGFIDEIKEYNKNVEYTLEDRIEIPKFDGIMSIEYSKVNDKEEN